jgi:hypothetical protein
MHTEKHDQRKAHRFIDGDGTKVDVIATCVIGTQAIVEFVREGGRLVYRMRRAVFEATFAPVGVARIQQASNQRAERVEIFVLPVLALAA